MSAIYRKVDETKQTAAALFQTKQKQTTNIHMITCDTVVPYGFPGFSDQGKNKTNKSTAQPFLPTQLHDSNLEATHRRLEVEAEGEGRGGGGDVSTGRKLHARPGCTQPPQNEIWVACQMPDARCQMPESICPHSYKMDTTVAVFAMATKKKKSCQHTTSETSAHARTAVVTFVEILLLLLLLLCVNVDLSRA